MNKIEKLDKPHTLALMQAIKDNDWVAFDQELPLANIRGQNNGPLRTALACGNLEMAERLFEKWAPPTQDIYLLMAAVQTNQLPAAQWINERFHFKKNQKALSIAAAFGSFECLQWLLTLPQSHPKKSGSHALQEAIINNHISCVELLLPVSNPKANFSLAAQNAAQYSPHMLPLLQHRCNFDDAINAMKNSKDPNWGAIACLQAFQTNKVLTQALEECTTVSTPSRKKM